MATTLGWTNDEVIGAIDELARERHIALDAAGTIVMAHPFASINLGFSVMGRITLWWGGCCWDSFALPHLLTDEPDVLVAMQCPGCGQAQAWVVDRHEPPKSDWAAHFLVPAAHVWDDVAHTCGNQRLFCSNSCVDAWLVATGNTRGYVMDIETLWHFASRWYEGDSNGDTYDASRPRPRTISSVSASLTSSGVHETGLRFDDLGYSALEGVAEMSGLNSTPGRQRAIGCIVGSAVGDALGAPFEFGQPGAYSSMFPQPVHGGAGEMVGNRIWQPGQFTDDTEMGVIVAESLLRSNGIDVDDQLARFRAWSRCAKDVGNLTREVVESALHAPEAATQVMLARDGRNTAGNGSIMRAAAGAVFFASRGRAATIDAALKLSAVTHADPLCLWAVAMQHELIRVALEGDDPIEAIDEVVYMLPDEIRNVYQPLLASSWTPLSPGPGNGSAMGALAQAVWALRRFDSFADVVTSVIDLGKDTDSVAAIAGALAGAKFGIQSIPSRWVTYLRGQVTDVDGNVHDYDHLALQQLALSLVGHPSYQGVDDEPALEPREVLPGVWASNRSGARTVPYEWAVVSLCRIDQSMRRPIRREVYLIDRDGDHNPALPAVVDDVLDSIDALVRERREVLVHCHGGRSRTGLVLAAYMMRHGRSFLDAQALLAKTWPDAYFLNEAFVEELQRRDGT